MPSLSKKTDPRSLSFSHSMFSRRLYLTDSCFPRPLSPLVRRDINHVEHILKLPLISPLLRTELRARRPSIGTGNNIYAAAAAHAMSLV